MAKLPVFRNPQLDGTSFYWEAGPTGVLLIHGYTATTTEVRLLALALHDHGYTISAPLLPGHGTSPEDCNQHTWQDWYATVKEAYQQLDSRCQRVVIGGESTGALLALRLAYAHPEAAAVLCYAPALRLKINPVLKNLLILFSPFIASVPKAPSEDDNPWKGYAVNPIKGALQLRSLQRLTPRVLPKVHQPVLILQGKLDQTVEPQSSQIIYDLLGSSIKELHWLENSTHCLILDKERDLAAELTLDFLKRVLPS